MIFFMLYILISVIIATLSYPICRKLGVKPIFLTAQNITILSIAWPLIFVIELISISVTFFRATVKKSEEI